MKNKLILFFCISTFQFLPTLVFGSSGWTDYSSVVELTPTSHGRFIFKLKISDNPSGCKNKETFYQDYGVSGADEMFRVLLEAVSAEKMVRVYVTGRCGINGYAEVSSVGIVP